jgi:hypothetical protein
VAKRDYKAEVAKLVEIARKHGYRVNFNWSNGTWRGMNPSAAAWLRKHKEYGDLRGRPFTRTITLNKHTETNDKKRSQTLRHELIEAKLMKRNGNGYPAAHKHACRLQSSTKPLKEKY